MKNKKGSLNLSIEAIVIVVIAFVVLGLGLGFVRSQIGQIQSTSTAVQEQISQQILDDLRTGNKKLSFPATKLVLETGEESVQAIGVKNTADSELILKVGFQIKTGERFSDFFSEVMGTFETTGEEITSKIIWDSSKITFAAGESRVIPVTITAPDKTGNYLYKILVYRVTGENNEEIFDERTFFVKTS